MGYRLVFVILLYCITSSTLFAQQSDLFGDIGNGYFRNPVLPSDYSDPDVIKVGEDYYGISSTFCFSPGMVVIHSKDLVNWEIINHVVDDISFLNPELSWDKMEGYYNGIWAGSLRLHNGIYYCHFATPKGGWFVATTSDIRGKWTVKPMKDANGRELRGRGWDDVCPLWDDDGQAYIIASNFGKHWFPHIYKMSVDGEQLLDAIIDEKCDPSKNIELIGGYVVKPYRTAEANKLYKWNGLYYIYFSEVRNIHGNNVRVPVMRRSKSIYGPYEEQLLMHSQGKEIDQEPNQGSIIEARSGQWYFVTHHGTGNFDGRMLSVLPVEWKDGWPHIGYDIDNDGVGEMVWQLERPHNEIVPYSIQTSDNFNTPHLGHQWEFNHQPRADKWSLTARKGYMRLYAFHQLRENDFFSIGNILSQRYIRWGKGQSVTKMDIRGMQIGQEAGIAHFNGGKDYATLCVILNEKEFELVLKKKLTKQKEEIISLSRLPKGTKNLYLKTEIDFTGKATFCWSTNGRKYHSTPMDYYLKWGNYRGSRIGIYTYNNKNDKGGYIDIDSFNYHKME